MTSLSAIDVGVAGKGRCGRNGSLARLMSSPSKTSTLFRSISPAPVMSFIVWVPMIDPMTAHTGPSTPPVAQDNTASASGRTG